MGTNQAPGHRHRCAVPEEILRFTSVQPAILGSGYPPTHTSSESDGNSLPGYLPAHAATSAREGGGALTAPRCSFGLRMLVVSWPIPRGHLTRRLRRRTRLPLRPALPRRRSPRVRLVPHGLPSSPNYGASPASISALPAAMKCPPVKTYHPSFCRSGPAYRRLIAIKWPP